MAILDARRKHKNSQRDSGGRGQSKEEGRRRAATINARHEFHDEERIKHDKQFEYAEILKKKTHFKVGFLL